MINDLNQKEIQEYVDLMNFRNDFPNLMQEGDWERYNNLRAKRFENE